MFFLFKHKKINRILLLSILLSTFFTKHVYAFEQMNTASAQTIEEAYMTYLNAVNSHIDTINLSLSPNADFQSLWSQIISKLDSHNRSYDDFNQESVSACGTPSNLVISITYYTTPEEEAILNAIATNLAFSLKGRSDYEKIKYTHDFICQTITYDEATAVGYRESRSAYDGLVNGSTVCCGYALAFQKMMDTMQIPCRILCGDSPEGPHAWNVVYLDGQWYHIDTTWDDREENVISYDFFLLGQDSLPFQYDYPDMNFTLANSSYKN